MESVAEAALTGARGNSGIIFAQYFRGLSETIEAEELIANIAALVPAKTEDENARRFDVLMYKLELASVVGDDVTVVGDDETRPLPPHGDDAGEALTVTSRQA